MKTNFAGSLTKQDVASLVSRVESLFDTHDIEKAASLVELGGSTVTSLLLQKVKSYSETQRSLLRDVFCKKNDIVSAGSTFEVINDWKPAANLYKSFYLYEHAGRCFLEADDLLNAATCFEYAGDLEAAENHYYKCGAWQQLGNLFFKQGRYLEASDIFRKKSLMDAEIGVLLRVPLNDSNSAKANARLLELLIEFGHVAMAVKFAGFLLTTDGAGQPKIAMPFIRKWASEILKKEGAFDSLDFAYSVLDELANQLGFALPNPCSGLSLQGPNAIKSYKTKRDDSPFSLIHLSTLDSLVSYQGRNNFFFLLQNISFFQKFSSESLNLLLECAELQMFKKGHVIIQKGNHSTGLYVIVTGKMSVDLCLKKESVGLPIEVSAGQCLGEISLLTPMPATATVTAVEDSQCLFLARFDFAEVIAHDERSALCFYEQIAPIIAKRYAKFISKLS